MIGDEIVAWTEMLSSRILVALIGEGGIVTDSLSLDAALTSELSSLEIRVYGIEFGATIDEL